MYQKSILSTSTHQLFLKIKCAPTLNRWGVLCKGPQPMPKMVTKSFGKRNFMQPMGRPKHALKVPCFFSFYVLGWGGGGWGGKIFFHFSQLPNVFALCSFQVPNGFPIFSPTFSPYLLTFIPYALENGVLFSPIQVGQRRGSVQFKIEPSVLGSLPFFLIWSDGPIKLARR